MDNWTKFGIVLFLFWASVHYGGKSYLNSVHYLFATGNIRYAVVLLLLGLNTLTNLLLMELEDLLFPSLAKYTFDESNQIVFIMGHPRSGTTNLHKAVSSLETCTTGLYFDILCPSLIIKFCFAWLIPLVDFLYLKFSGHNVPNHQLGMKEELEEHLIIGLQAESELISFYLFPPVGACRDLVREMVNPNERNMRFVKKVMARIFYHRGLTEKNLMYIGCPLGFSIDPKFIETQFPNAKFVICVRDPVDAIPSYIDLVTAMTRQPYDKQFRYNFNIYYELFCTNVYKALADATETIDKDKIFWLDFEDWKADNTKQLKLIWEFLGLTEASQQKQESDLKKALARTRRHKNRPESYEVIDAERIKKELNPYYEIMKKRCVTDSGRAV